MKESVSPSVVSDSLRPHGRTRLLCPWNSPSKNTGVGCQSLLQRIFPTHGLNLGLLHCGHTLYHLSHQGSPYHYIYMSLIHLILLFLFLLWIIFKVFIEFVTILLLFHLFGHRHVES